MIFKSKLENEKQYTRFLFRIIFGLIILLVVMAIGWSTAPTDIRLHYPPDLRTGGSMGINEISEAEVYVFTGYILQQLNNWKDNGEVDYIKKINLLRSYFTPNYQAYLKSDYDKRKRQGELRNRVRNWSFTSDAMYEDKLVEKVGKGWLVWLDVNIKEYVSGGIVKNIVLRMPMQVVRYDVDPETNPWGLGLNGPGNYRSNLVEAN